MFVWLMMIDGPLSSFQGRSSSASSFHASLQVIDGVMSLALCPLAVSQAPQHFRSSNMQVTYEGYFAHQSICSVISLHSGMSKAAHPQEFFKVDVNHWHTHAVWADSDLFVLSQYWKGRSLTALHCPNFNIFLVLK